MPTDNTDNAEQRYSLAELTQRLAAQGFTHLRTLGKGEFGTVGLYQYDGNDPAIISLCDTNSCIAVKLSEIPDKNEKDIANHLAENLPKNSKVNFNCTLPLADKDGLIGIISQYETVEANKSSDLEGFFCKLNTPAEFSTNVSAAFNDNFSIMLSQLTNSIHISQADLHSLSILHLDTATRNFLLNAEKDHHGNIIEFKAKIADYGLSQILNDGNNSVQFPNINKAPGKWMDYGALSTGGQCSVKTDLFARKVAMVGMLGIAATGHRKEADLLKLEQAGNANFFAERFSKYQHDDDALNQYLANVKSNISQSNDPIKKEEMELFVECYEKYLTSLPDTLSIQEAEAIDHAMLMEANNNYVAKMLAKLTNDNSLQVDNNKLLLGLQRLERIEITDPALKENLNVAIIQSTINNKANDLIASPPSPAKLEDFLTTINQMLAMAVPADFKASDYYQEMQSLNSMQKIADRFYTAEQQAQLEQNLINNPGSPINSQTQQEENLSNNIPTAIESDLPDSLPNNYFNLQQANAVNNSNYQTIASKPFEKTSQQFTAGTETDKSNITLPNNYIKLPQTQNNETLQNNSKSANNNSFFAKAFANLKALGQESYSVIKEIGRTIINAVSQLFFNESPAKQSVENNTDSQMNNVEIKSSSTSRMAASLFNNNIEKAKNHLSNSGIRQKWEDLEEVLQQVEVAYNNYVAVKDRIKLADGGIAEYQATRDADYEGMKKQIKIIQNNFPKIQNNYLKYQDEKGNIDGHKPPEAIAKMLKNNYEKYQQDLNNIKSDVAKFDPTKVVAAQSLPSEQANLTTGTPGLSRSNR